MALRRRALLELLARRRLAVAQPPLRRTFANAAEAAPPSAPARSVSGGPVSWASFALVALTGAGIVTYFNAKRQRKVEAALAKAAVKSAGNSLIGGDFELVDQDGKRFTSDQLKGAFSLLYFGFTFCPDICPDELVKMAETVDLVEKQTGRLVTPVFISIDPERDTVKQIHDYVKEFHPRLLGLTGSVEACAAAARKFRVYYHRTDDTADYLVDHSIIMYLLNPEGKFVAFYGKHVLAPELAAAISGHVATWPWGRTPVVAAAGAATAGGGAVAAPAVAAAAKT